VAERQTRPT